MWRGLINSTNLHVKNLHKMYNREKPSKNGTKPPENATKVSYKCTKPL